MLVRYKRNKVRLVYDPTFLPTVPHEPSPVLCGPFDRCEGCPYPGHGFICWGENGCIRTEMAKIMERSRSAALAGCLTASQS